ncbi:MAG: bifunctional 4-hydroxy-3-methylbut-2-enyl diphosphate reductase/30S ribosomal protein S1 [Oscillospiraceae bacterium]|nr:bifunctional 4-hydroxy-3-methylbut-2-enyl diphosphate reductase/30S ribosomal protein S1 [Oscillospiraceae bacterium]
MPMRNERIRLAKTAGFCFGVNRAVDMLYKMVGDGEKVCTLGPIIHNPQVIADLEKRGVKIAETPKDAPEGYKIVIRTHGVTEQEIREIEELGRTYINATCPFVMKIHRIIKEHSLPGTVTLIAGDSHHPEVQGFRSHCKGDSFVYKDCEGLEALLEKNGDFSGKMQICVAQTTFSIKEWEKCLKILKIHCTNRKIFDTICSATNERQKEAEQLSVDCDAMIVVGGRTSSNTYKLKKVCEKNCPTYLIETAKELEEIDLSGFDLIGVTAGASTPAGIIKEVLFTMSEILNEQTPNSEEMSFEAALEESLKSMSTDQKVLGVVVGIAPNEIQVDIGRKYAGFIPAEEYSNDPTADPMKELKIGDELNLIIMKTNDVEGTIMLSKRRYDSIAAWDNIIKAEEEQTILEGTVAEVIRGGVLVYTMGVRVFIPASLTGLGRDEELESLLNKKVRFRIIEVNQQRRRAVGSIRSVLREERKAAREAFWENVQEGQVYTGKVKSLTSYGAFVDIGGVDGMIHISELSWTRIKHPSEVVNVGDTVEVYVKALDRENKKISLGYKKVEDNPWEILRRDYPVGTVVDATIVGMTTFGAFANIIPGIDGLIHISQIADRHIAKPQDVLKIGEVVKAKITEIDFEKKRVSLSIRALIEDEEAEIVAEAEEAAEVAEAVEEAAEVAEAVEEAAEEAVEDSIEAATEEAIVEDVLSAEEEKSE